MNETMKIAIIGLGLIGGSLAKAIKEYTAHTVYGYDINGEVLHSARSDGAIDGVATPHRLAECGIVIVGLYAEATADYIRENAKKIKSDALVCDLCGVKRDICAALSPIAAEHGFYFLGCHPMAGKEVSGYDCSEASLFEGASMILTPDDTISQEMLEFADGFYRSLGFAKVVVTTPAEHDRVIAFTSQLAHIVSSAYIKSPTSRNHDGFSAGSYRDLTRVARMNDAMWAHHFMLDRDYLSNEISEIILHLEEYKSALDSGDEETLRRLIREGTEIKLSDI